jgi:hypothetical protein
MDAGIVSIASASDGLRIVASAMNTFKRASTVHGLYLEAF